MLADTYAINEPTSILSMLMWPSTLLVPWVTEYHPHHTPTQDRQALQGNRMNAVMLTKRPMGSLLLVTPPNRQVAVSKTSPDSLPSHPLGVIPNMVTV